MLVASSAGELSAVAKRDSKWGAAPRKTETKELACDERCIDQKKGSMTNP